MKNFFICLVFLPFCINAKQIPNSEAVELYNSQLDHTRKMVNEIQQTLIASDAVFEMYKNLGYITPEVVAVSRHLTILSEDAQEFYGKNLLEHPTPFSSCATLAATAYNYWITRLGNTHGDKTDIANAQAQSYISQGKACMSSINTPPPKYIEESDDLEIIDVDN